jgi:hypothetical protein
MRTLFTCVQFLCATVAATAQVPEAEQAFIVTRVVITDPEGNHTPPKRESGGGGNLIVRSATSGNTRIGQNIVVRGYQKGDPCTFTSETWCKAGNTHTSVKYGDWNFVNIRNREMGEHISYTEPTDPDRMLQSMLPPDLSPGAGVVRSSGALNFSSGSMITDAEIAAFKEKNSHIGQPLLDTMGIQVVVLLQEVGQEIAGYPCKRAFINLMRNDSLVAQVKAWYNTQVRLSELPATGNPFDAASNLFNAQTGLLYALAKLPGLAMRYEIPDLYGNTISAEVTKLKTNKKPHKNQFKAPGAANIKPFAEQRAVALPPAQ